MVVTIDCRDTINCKVTIVLCNSALFSTNNDKNVPLHSQNWIAYKLL